MLHPLSTSARCIFKEPSMTAGRRPTTHPRGQSLSRDSLSGQPVSLFVDAASMGGLTYDRRNSIGRAVHPLHRHHLLHLRTLHHVTYSCQPANAGIWMPRSRDKQPSMVMMMITPTTFSGFHLTLPLSQHANSRLSSTIPETSPHTKKS